MSCPAHQLRPGTPGDHDFLWKLNVDCYRSHIELLWGWDEAWRRRHSQEQLGGRGDVQNIIQVQEEPVGYLELEHREDEIFLSNIQICPQHQDHGLGSRLIQEVMEEARSVAKDVTLQVFRTNDRAADLYDGLLGVAHRQYDPEGKLRLMSKPTATSAVAVEYATSQQLDAAFFHVLGCSGGWLEVKHQLSKNRGWLAPHMQCPSPVTNCN